MGAHTKLKWRVAYHCLVPILSMRWDLCPLASWFHILYKVRHWSMEQIWKSVQIIFSKWRFLVCVFKPNRNNYIEIETALDLTKYLAEEDEIIVWHTVLGNLLPSNFVSDVGNYDTYTLLKVISFFVLWFKRIHSSSFYILKSTCETDLSKSSLFI